MACTVREQNGLNAVVDYDNGDKYEGVWNANLCKKEGFGQWSSKKGDVYNGPFLDDKKDGKGTYVFADKGLYTGEFAADRRQGEGKRVWASGDKYVGQWNQDTMHGHGTLTYVNGDKYRGRWENGRRHDEDAHYKWKNGESFDGKFDEGSLMRTDGSWVLNS